MRALKTLARDTLVKGPVENAFAHSLMLQGIRTSQDYEEGLSAINQKRQPNFIGR